jgi:hypothetical protein
LLGECVVSCPLDLRVRVEWAGLPSLVETVRRSMKGRGESRNEVLSAELLQLANDARSARAALEVTSAEYAYRLAVLARAASGRRAGEGSAMEACARAAHVSRQVLQECSPPVKLTPARH